MYIGDVQGWKTMNIPTCFFFLQVETRYLGFVNGYSVSPNMQVKHTICLNIRRCSVEDTVDIETLVVNNLYVTLKDLGDSLYSRTPNLLIPSLPFKWNNKVCT